MVLQNIYLSSIILYVNLRNIKRSAVYNTVYNISKKSFVRFGVAIYLQ